MANPVDAHTSLTTRPRVLLICTVPIQSQLTGPAIRCLGLAQQVSRVADVTVTAYRSIDRATPGVAQHAYRTEQELLDLAQAHDAFLAQGTMTYSHSKLLASDRVKIFDLYDPLNLEILEHGQQVAWDQHLLEYRGVQAAFTGQLATGDFFLCANARQRDYYLGMLAAAGRINPITYAAGDRDLRQLLAVVPMGIAAQPPRPTRPVLRGVHPAIQPNDIVLIWGGSLLDWLDPLTLIQAMAQVCAQRADVKLFFLASRNPVTLDAHSIAARAIDLCRELNLLDQTVIFNDDWVPYEDRVNYLLEADIGVTTHLDHLEARFSFRTRVLDYLWAGLPMISSTGDDFGDLIQQEQLGLTVPPGHVDTLAQAILTLASDVDLRRRHAANVRRVAQAFAWDKVAQPLVEFCRAPQHAIDREFDRVDNGSDRVQVITAPALIDTLISEMRRDRRSRRARLSAQFRHTAKQILKRRYIVMRYGQTIEAEGVLLPGQRRGQTFVADAPMLTGLRLMIGTFRRMNTCELVLHLCDSPAAAKELATSRMNAAVMQDYEFCTFAFPPVANASGQELYFWIESPDAELSDGVTLFRDVDTGALVFRQQY